MIMVVPKPSKNMVNMMVFSLNERYRLNNYKIEIRGRNMVGKKEAVIYYKTMNDMMIPMSYLNSGINSTLSFTIENLFILNRKTSRHTIGENVHFFETYSVDGEPGSAGNWTKEQYDEIGRQFTEIFSSLQQ